MHFPFSNHYFTQSVHILNRASQTGNSDCYQLVNIGTILRTFSLCLTYIRDVTQLQNQQPCQRTEPPDLVLQFYATVLTRVQYQMLPKSRQTVGWLARGPKKKRRTNLKQHPSAIYYVHNHWCACGLPEEPRFTLAQRKR